MDFQPEILGHHVEVAIIMQEPMTFRHAKCPNDHVNCLAYRDPSRTKALVIEGCLDRQAIIHHSRDGVSPEITLDSNRMGVIPGSLQDLEHDQVADQNLIIVPVGQRAELKRRGIVDAAEQCDPRRAVDNDHGS
jgi:hypothetical protein